MLSPVKILRKTIIPVLINRKTTVNCEVLRKTSVPCSLDMEHIIFPVFVSAEVGTINSSTWVITFSEDLDNIVPLVAENAFISAGFTFNSITKTGVKEIRLISDQEVVFGQVLTLQYNKSLTLNPLQGTNSVKVPSFTKSVTNNVLQAPAFVSAEVGLIDAYTIDMLFDRALWDIKIPDVTDLLPVFTGSELLTGWTENLAWNTFEANGKDITLAINSNATNRVAQSNNIVVTDGDIINISINCTINSGYKPALRWFTRKTSNSTWWESYNWNLDNGLNQIQVTVPSDRNLTYFRIQNVACPIYAAELGVLNFTLLSVDFSAICSIKILTAVDQIYDRTITGLHLYAKTGIDSWYLPSRDELQEIYNELILYGIGGFPVSGTYWTSSEYNATESYLIDLDVGEFSPAIKSNITNLRSIRSFTSLKSYALRDVGPAGGWVFYKDGNNYLECAPSDEVNSAWSNIDSLLIGTTGTAIGTGQANTTAIIGQAGHTASAAKLCDDLVIGRAITAGETGTIQYVPNADNDKKLQGTNGARVVAFTESVTNNVPASVPVLQSITCADGYNIVHTYDLALDETSTPATSAYAIAGHTVTAVVVSGLTSTVTVTERIYWGDSDTSAYTKPATNMIKSTGGGEAASFTATPVTNSVTQLAFQNANTLMWLLSEDLSTITKDGANLVSRWNDRQGSGRDLVQATGSNQPLWDSLGVLFDGVDNFMVSDTFTLNQPTFIYLVVKQVTWTLNDQFFDGFTALTGMIVQSASTPGIRIWAGSFGGQNNNLPINTFAIIRVLFNGATSSIQVNTTGATVNNVGVANMSGFTLAKRAGSTLYGNIQVKEIILRNTADDVSTEAAIYAYLSSKYGI